MSCQTVSNLNALQHKGPFTLRCTALRGSSAAKLMREWTVIVIILFLLFLFRAAASAVEPCCLAHLVFVVSVTVVYLYMI